MQEVAARSLGIRYDKQWVISGLGNTRETHEIMDGVVVDMDEPFTARLSNDVPTRQQSWRTCWGDNQLRL